MHNGRFTILTFLKCTIQWHKVHSQCCATVTTTCFPELFTIPNRICVLPGCYCPLSRSLSPWEPLYDIVSMNLPDLVPHGSGIRHYVLLWAWLISPSKMFSGSIHIAVCIRTFFLLFPVWMDHFCLNIHLWWTLELFLPFLVIVTNTALNSCVHLSVWVPVRNSLRSDGSYGNSMCHFLKSQTVLHRECAMLHLHQQLISVFLIQNFMYTYLLNKIHINLIN